MSEQLIQWSPGVTLAQVEKQVILKAFKHYGFNKTVTANALGISIRTLDGRLEAYAHEENEAQKVLAEKMKKEQEFQLRQRGIAIPPTSPIAQVQEPVAFEPEPLQTPKVARKRK